MHRDATPCRKNLSKTFWPFCGSLPSPLLGVEWTQISLIERLQKIEAISEVAFDYLR